MLLLPYFCLRMFSDKSLLSALQITSRFTSVPYVFTWSPWWGGGGGGLPDHQYRICSCENYLLQGSDLFIRRKGLLPQTSLCHTPTFTFTDRTEANILGMEEKKSFTSSTSLKPNSWTYNHVKVSGHNLESSQKWGFCMDFLNHGGSGYGFLSGFPPFSSTETVRGCLSLKK